MFNRYGALVLFTLLLPMAAAGHDAYIYMQNPAQGIILSDLGYIWSTYASQHYFETRKAMQASLWADLSVVLEQKAVYVALALSIGTLLLVVAQYAFFKLVFGGIGGAKRIFAKERTFTREEILGKKPTRYKYKRR